MDHAASPDASQSKPLENLIGLLGLQGPLVALAALCASLAAALALVPFFVVARMAAAVYATPPRLDEVSSLAWLALGAIALRYVFIGGANMLAHVSAFHILHELRLRLARKLGAVPLSFFSRRTSGELKRTMMDDVTQVEAFVAHHFPDAVAAIIVPISTAVALFWVDYRMALASLAMAPLAVFAMSLAMRDVGEAHQQWNSIQDRMNASLLEYLRGIHVIKSFGLTARRFGDLASSIQEGIRWMEGFMRTNGKGYGAFGALIGSSLVVLIPVGGWLHLRGSLSLESLVLFLVLGPQLLTSMLRLMFAWGNVDRIRLGNARIRSILSTPDLEDATATGAVPQHSGVSFRDVGFEYEPGGRAVLEGVTFDAEPGRVTAIVGASGAGKSTLLRLVPRLWEPTRGTIELGGVNVRALPLDGLLERVSLVFQDVFLFHGTVLENLQLARADASHEDVVAACRAARAHDFICALPQGYGTLLGERGARLSGGEKQRLSIARALLKDAPLLLLDEATAFTDPENEARIQDALSTLCAGRSVLVIAHRLATIAGADRIVVLAAGKVLDQGTHRELLARCALYQQLWADQSDAAGWSLGDAPEGASAAAAESSPGLTTTGTERDSQQPSAASEVA